MDGKTVNIYTGQDTYVGTATLVLNSSGNYDITILLEGYEFMDGGLVHLQGYTKKPPTKPPAPGQMRTFVTEASRSTVTLENVPSKDNGKTFIYYAIHMMVHED